METTEIKAICIDIKNSELEKTDKLQYFKSKYTEFVTDYPKLFNACIEDAFPLTHLDLMLQTMNDMREKKLKTIEDADKHVYGELKKVYMSAFQD
jgi:hypothetical protein